MITKYGELPLELWFEYKLKLIGKVYKILPMREENCSTWSVYVQSLLHELVGNKELVEELKHNANFLSLLGTLENLVVVENDVKAIKREVFKCLDIIKKL